jgi:hypothetical protein
MGFVPALPTRVRRSSCALLLMLAGVAGCETQRLNAPENAAPVPTDLQNVAQVEFEVNPQSGAVTLRRAGSERTGEDLRGLAVPVTAEHLQAAAQCEGCDDRILDNQTITVRFTVKHFVLEGVDFRRNGGNAIAAMTCTNCSVVSAVLRGVQPVPMPNPVGPEQVFEAVLRVNALTLEPFVVRFDLVAVAVRVPTRFAQVSANGNHTCALRPNGSIACWGLNDEGQATPPAGAFVQVSAGNYHSCARRSNNSLTCWGENDYGQITVPAGTFSQVSAGGFHTCAIRTNGTLACWGRNNHGQTVAPSGTFTQVSAGGLHTCAIRTNGTLACWGLNDDGQTVVPSGTFTQVSAGFYHTCARRGDGTLACWGWNQLGQSTPPAGTFAQVGAGFFHTCAVGSDGTIACWGYNDEGQTTGASGAFSWVSSGRYHSCALRPAGTLVCWGSNSDGQRSPPWW